MRVMDLSWSTHRRAPSFPHTGGDSPQVGGCVGKVYQFFDFQNLTKQLPSTKRIIADRPNQDVFYRERDRRIAERSITTTSKPPVDIEKEEVVSTLTTLLHSTPSPVSINSGDMSKHVPGVVARLMGLESLPGGAYISSPKSGTSHNILTKPPADREQPDPTPVLLQELLQLEFQQSKKSLRDKFPAFKRRGHQKRNPTTDSEGHLQRHGNSRSSRSVLHSEKDSVAFTDSEEGNLAITSNLQPLRARLQTGASLPQPSNSQVTSNSPLLSPSMIRGKDTLRLLEAAVKALEPNMQPSPRDRIYSQITVRKSHQETSQSESSCVSSRSRTVHGSQLGRRSANSSSRSSNSPSRSPNSSSRSFRSPSMSRTSSGQMDDWAVRGGHESVSPHSRSSRRGRQVQASRTRTFEKTLVTSPRSVSPLQSNRCRAGNYTKRVEDSPPRALLGSHEASIRGFKTDLSNLVDESPSTKLVRDFHPQSVDFEEVHSRKLLFTAPSLTNEHSNAMVLDSPDDPCDLDKIADILKVAISETSPLMSKSVSEKLSSGRVRSMLFRSRSRKQEKDVGGQGNRVFPSDKHPADQKQVEQLPPTKDAKVSGPRFSYSLLFSRKHGDKKEGSNDEGEAHVKNRLDSTLVRSLLKRKSKTSKRVEKMEPADASPQSESALSPTQLKQLERTKDPGIMQARCRSIDDVFPELPMEEKDASGVSPDLAKTIQAVESKFLGFGSSQGVDADCQSIERMFGKLGSMPRTLHVESAASETSPEEFATESSGVPGTFPNSPSAENEGSSFFPSRNHLNLQEMFEVVSGDRRHDSTGRRRSVCTLSEPRSERVLDDEEAEAESDTCSSSSVISGRVEIQRIAEWNMDAMTPPALKKFEEILAQGFSDGADDSHVIPCGDECGQPSPVSVLQSPFLEEESTAPDPSLAELQQGDEHLNDIEDAESSALEDHEEEPTEETNEHIMVTSNILEIALPETIETDVMIEQAILQISKIRNIDVTPTELEALAIAPAEPQQEQNYIREVLEAANLLRDHRDAGIWRSDHSPMNRSLFDRVDSGRGILRSERRLLFDSVNEVMEIEPWTQTSSFYVDVPMFPDLHFNSKLRLPILSGEALVIEVHRMICHWRDIAGTFLDDLIDYDMGVREGRWQNFSREVAHVGLQIERALLKGMIKEVVDDLTSISATRALRIS